MANEEAADLLRPWTFEQKLTFLCALLADLAKEQGYDITLEAWQYGSYKVTLMRSGYPGQAPDEAK